MSENELNNPGIQRRVQEIPLRSRWVSNLYTGRNTWRAAGALALKARCLQEKVQGRNRIEMADTR